MELILSSLLEVLRYNNKRLYSAIVVGLIFYLKIGFELLLKTKVSVFCSEQTYFVVMSNILQSDVFMNKVYDLKGSSQGRTNKKIKVRDKTILKDIDLDFCFYVDSLARHRLIK